MCDKQFIKTFPLSFLELFMCLMMIHKQVGGESFTQLQFQHHGQSSERGWLRLNPEDRWRNFKQENQSKAALDGLKAVSMQRRVLRFVQTALLCHVFQQYTRQKDAEQRTEGYILQISFLPKTNIFRCNSVPVADTLSTVIFCDASLWFQSDSFCFYDRALVKPTETSRVSL